MSDEEIEERLAQHLQAVRDEHAKHREHMRQVYANQMADLSRMLESQDRSSFAAAILTGACTHDYVRGLAGCPEDRKRFVRNVWLLAEAMVEEEPIK